LGAQVSGHIVILKRNVKNKKKQKTPETREAASRYDQKDENQNGTVKFKKTPPVKGKA
jgi:hypothetical protein